MEIGVEVGEKHQKVTEDLARRASLSSQEEALDVIVELNPRPSTTQSKVSSSSSRSERIAERKESFARISTPVEDAILRAGGVVTDKAWINRTLKARVPVESLKQICELDEVGRLDAPHDIEPDTKRRPA